MWKMELVIYYPNPSGRNPEPISFIYYRLKRPW